jgi:ribonuclease HII
VLICGIDEAGRGPVAGPLVVAGCILHRDVENLTDSKKLSPTKRELLFEQITQNAAYEIVITSNVQIDTKGLSRAIADSLRQIKTALKADRYIFDGNSTFGVSAIETMIKGDLKEKNISAASILAKVTRDRMMQQEAKNYPEYDFKSHKGYITKKHIQEIQKHGYSDFHRKSVQIKALQKTLFDV